MGSGWWSNHLTLFHLSTNLDSFIIVSFLINLWICGRYSIAVLLARLVPADVVEGECLRIKSLLWDSTLSPLYPHSSLTSAWNYWWDCLLPQDEVSSIYFSAPDWSSSAICAFSVSGGCRNLDGGLVVYQSVLKMLFTRVVLMEDTFTCKLYSNVKGSVKITLK